MKRALPPHCYQKPNGVYFQRRGCQTVRIIAPFGTAEFAREYALALQGTPIAPVGGRTFALLIREYQRSTKWAKLAPRTQSDYQTVLDYITAKFGTLAPAKMQRKDVIRAQTANATTVRFANYIVQVLRILFEYSIDLGWREDNPAKGVESLKSGLPEREPWPPELIEAYRAAAPIGTRERAVFELGIGTGQRPADLLKMRWDDIKDGMIRVKQGKTGTVLWIPITRALQAALDGTPRRGLTICADDQGFPTGYRAAAWAVLVIRKKIGAEAYDMHSWRYTAAAELGAAGCTDEQIASITGHKTAAMVGKYAGAARQKSRAVEAMKRREG